MNREEIIQMAREAGFVDASFCRWSAYLDDLERFAALVAAAEREVCAQLCEDEAEKWEGEDGSISTEARLCAINIRARGKE